MTGDSMDEVPVGDDRRGRTETERRSRRWVVALAPLVLLWSSSELRTSPPKAVHEYKVKALFMYNFGKFVEWPSAAFKTKNAPFVIGVLGDDEFCSFLQAVVSNGKVRGRGFVVKKFDDVKSIGDCQMLFVGRSEKKNLAAALIKVQKKSVLTVSDIPDFAEEGGVVGFVTKGKKVGLEFNVRAADKAGIKLSSKLLRVGTVKQRGENTEDTP